MTEPQEKTTRSSGGVLSWLVTLFWILVIVVLALVVVAIISAAVLLVGRILTQFFEVRVFEAALIVLGVAACAVFAFIQSTRGQHVLGPVHDWEEDEDWDDYDDEEDFEDEEDDVIIPPHSRNDPCPCGSGKKYKYCHGKAV